MFAMRWTKKVKVFLRKKSSSYSHYGLSYEYSIMYSKQFNAWCSVLDSVQYGNTHTLELSVTYIYKIHGFLLEEVVPQRKNLLGQQVDVWVQFIVE